MHELTSKECTINQFPTTSKETISLKFVSIILRRDFVDVATGSSYSFSLRSEISPSKSIKKNAFLSFNTFCSVNLQNLLKTSSFLFLLSFSALIVVAFYASTTVEYIWTCCNMICDKVPLQQIYLVWSHLLPPSSN